MVRQLGGCQMASLYSFKRDKLFTSFLPHANILLDTLASPRGTRTGNRHVLCEPIWCFCYVSSTRTVCMSHCTCSTAYVTTSSLRRLPLFCFSTRRTSLGKKSRKFISASVFQNMMVRVKTSQWWCFLSHEWWLPQLLYHRDTKLVCGEEFGHSVTGLHCLWNRTPARTRVNGHLPETKGWDKATS